MNTPPSRGSPSLSALISTPLKQRSGSIRDSGATTPLSLDTLDQMMAIELEDVTLKNASLLITSIFAAGNLPVQIDRNFLESKLSELYQGDRWCNSPGTGELTLATWLNWIGTALGVATNSGVHRKWSADHHGKPLPGPIKRKPDIILVDVHDVGWQPKWSDVHALGEVTSSSTIMPRIHRTLQSKAYLAMNHQHNRRFIAFLTFFNTESFQFGICDRAGLVKSPVYDIHKNAIELVIILMGLMHGDGFLLGYDPSILTGPEGNLMAIKVDGSEYSIVELIFSSSSLRGRATRCWHVKRDEQDYVIKDSWIHEGRTASEVDILQKVSHIPCVPTIIKGEDLKYPGANYGDDESVILDSTKLHREGIEYSEARIHRRILMKPVGISICHFASKKELIGAVIDVISAHETLYKSNRILHRDISKNNILLWQDPNFTENRRRGLLIDFDYAALLDSDSKYSLGTRTGTGPFMALELLEFEGQTKQGPAHDMESIFYVLLYICSMFKGPGNLKRPEAETSSMDIAEWFIPYTRWKHLFDKKYSQLTDLDGRFLSKFHPYFHELRSCISKLWDVLFPSLAKDGKVYLRNLRNCRGTHTEMLEVLNFTYGKLPDQDTVEAEPESVLSQQTMARKRPADNPHQETTGRIAKKRSSK